jgi:integrase
VLCWTGTEHTVIPLSGSIPIYRDQKDGNSLPEGCAIRQVANVSPTGLRAFEVCALHVADIDSAPDRIGLRVVAGKDRYTLLSPSRLKARRVYWRIPTHRDRRFATA